MATVEGAIALCSLVAVFGLVLTGISAAIDQVRCTDAAVAAARALARGQSQQEVQRLIGTIAPPDATLTVDHTGTTVSVNVVAHAMHGLLPGVDVRAGATAELEPGVGLGIADVGG